MKSGILLFAFMMVMSLRGWSDNWDYSGGFSARSMPAGASLDGQIGYNAKVWGDPTRGFKYGFVRPNLNLSTSVVFSAADLRVSIYPISILGIDLGTTVSDSQTDFQTIDCTVNECRGVLRSNYAGTNLTLGAGNYFFLGRFQWARYFPDQSTQPFVEPYAVLAGAPGGDSLFFRDQLIGYQFKNHTAAGLYFSQANMISQQTSNSLMSAFARHSWGNVIATLGAGAYTSSTQGLAAAVFGVLEVLGPHSLMLQ